MISWRDPWGSLSPIPVSAQDHSKISVVQTLSELWEAQCHDLFPAEPFPVSDHLLIEEPFADIQPQFLQLRAIDQDFQISFSKAALQHLITQSVCIASLAPSLATVKLHVDGDCLTLQFIKISL